MVSVVHSQSSDSARGSVADQYSSTLLYTDHWAYTYIQLLQDRGFFKELFYSVKPYKRIDLALALQHVPQEKLPETERYWIALLREEMEPELKLLRRENSELVGFKTTLQEKSYSQQGKLRSDYLVDPELNYTAERLSVSARGNIDRGLLHDSTYTGRRSKYFGARLEDGYGLFQFGKINFFIGRAAQNWSPFAHQSLILSDNPYTYDQVGLAYTSRNVLFHSVFAKLDPIQSAGRFFSAHRLDIKLNNGMNFGFSESVLFGGVNQGVELSYVNPFTIFANAQLNEGKEANEMVAMDFFIPMEKTNFKGQLLIDDFILDGASKPPPNRKTSPDRLGFILGVQRNDLILANSQINLTYERVGSYTYNVKAKRPWQAYTYLNRGLGDAANDQDGLSMNYKYFPIPKFIFILDLHYARQGSRNLQSNNFEDSNFVKLPFPSGVVERHTAVNVSAIYQPSRRILAEASVGFEHIQNWQHVNGNKKNFLNCELRLNWIFTNKTYSL
jgi:hypothetical protein